MARSKYPTEEISSQVSQALDANKELAATKMEADRGLWEQKIRAIEDSINSMVYELYSLSAGDISEIEAAGGP